MKKQKLLAQIIEKLNIDLTIFLAAAKTAHEAATHSENAPDNKYDTLALEASYIAQGQANRAQELRRSIEIYKQFNFMPVDGIVHLSSLVTIESDEGGMKTVFIGSVEGGMRIDDNRKEIMLITPTSPLGKELMGKSCGESAEIGVGNGKVCYEIVEIV